MINESATLLLVDDQSDNLFVLRQVIARHLPDCRILTATSAEEGLALADVEVPDGALIDMQMPGMDGIEMCRHLKSRLRTATTPVILMTAQHSTAELRALV